METRECFINELSLQQVEILYLLMVNRISMGYSPHDLAFLMGEEPDYISSIERLKNVYLEEDILYKLKQVFRFFKQDFQDVFEDDTPIDEYRMSILQMPEKTIYTLERTIPPHDLELVFYLPDISGQFDLQAPKNIKEQKEICEMLQEFIQTKAFIKPFSAHDIFLVTQHLLEYRISPSNFAHEFNKLVGEKGQAPIVCVSSVFTPLYELYEPLSIKQPQSKTKSTRSSYRKTRASDQTIGSSKENAT